jgi:hypothetical protein
VKEVKIVRLDELVESSKWSTYSYIIANDAGPGEKEDSKNFRPEMEQKLASLLNDGWQIKGTGGERLGDAYVILVRER